MSGKHNKEKSNKEVLHLFHQDGIIDLISGAVLVNFGFDILNSNETTSLFTWIPILFLSSIKNKTTIPRLGYEALGGDRRQINRWTFYPSIGIVLAITALGILILNDPLNIESLSMLPIAGNSKSLFGGLILSFACLLTGMFGSIKRFYVYAAAALLAGLIGFFFLPQYFPFFLTAAVMIAYGARLMITFLRAHPLNVESKKIEK